VGLFLYQETPRKLGTQSPLRALHYSPAKRCTIRAPFTSAAIVSPTLLSAPVSWTRSSNFEAFVVFLKSGSVIRRLASLHWLRPGAVRQLQRYYQDAMTSCRPSRFASLPSLGGTSVALVRFAPRRTSAPQRPGVVHPVAPSGNVAEETTGSPKFLGEPQVSVCTCSVDSGGTARARPLRCSSMALGM
jgi:hypothetical protein